MKNTNESLIGVDNNVLVELIKGNDFWRNGKLEEAKSIYRKILVNCSSAAINYALICLRQKDIISAKLVLKYIKDQTAGELISSSLLKEFDESTLLSRAPSNPKVSIIVPVYNTEKYLERCILSILKQSYKNLELIIINDGSTDGSHKIIEKFTNDKRVKYLVNQVASGNPGTPRNIGIKNTSGFYIGFIDSDDWISQDYIEKLINAGAQGGDIIFSSGHINCFKEKEMIVDYKSCYFNNKKHPLYKYHDSHNIWGKLYRADFLKKNNIFLAETMAAVDLIFVLKSYFYSTNSVFCRENNGYFYTVESESSVTLNRRKKSDCDFLFQAYDQVDQWLDSISAPVWYRNIVDLKKVYSYLYTYKIIHPEFKRDYEYKVFKIFSDMNEFIISEYLDILKREDYLKLFKSIKSKYKK